MRGALNLDNIKPLSPDHALEHRDLESLRHILEKGWSPQFKMKSGGGRDLSTALRIIDMGWTEGWLLLREFFPELIKNRILWEHAIHHARAGIVSDFVNHGFDPCTPDVVNDVEWSSAHKVINAIARNINMHNMPWGYQDNRTLTDEEDEAIIATLSVLKKSGVDIDEPHPGLFFWGDLSPSGHTLWTRAIAHQRWHLASLCMPKTWAEVLNQPRALEAASYLRAAALKSLSDKSLSEKSQSEKGQSEKSQADKAAEVSSNQLSESSEMPEEVKIWQLWLSLFVGPWLKTANAALDQAEDLPFILLLDGPGRQEVWRYWTNATDEGWSGLHQLALHAPSAYKTLEQMVADKAPCLSLWNSADSSDTTPGQLWRLACSDAWGLSKSPVPTINDEHDESLPAWTIDEALAHSPPVSSPVS